MSAQYEVYLREHVAAVKTAWDWMKDHGLIPERDRNGNVIYPDLLHDDTKYTREEYEAYDDYFYGKEGKDEDDIAVIDSAFDYAWLHHIHANPHHWQHWLLFEDEGSIKALEMPEQYAYEMIADWWSFSWRKGETKEIFDWYKKHEPKMKLHPKTKEIVEKTLKSIRDILEAEEKDAP